jgi:soluble lytic murein transglycosylase-like protein
VTAHYAKFIFECAGRFNLPVELVAAVILQESRGDAFAIRYEPLFFVRYIDGKKLNHYVPKTISPTTERHSRAMSWGLMQIMGETARQFGFDGESLAELVEPETNIEIGCRILSRHSEKTADMEATLLRYNGGGNKSYPKEVIGRISSGEIDALLK